MAESDHLLILMRHATAEPYGTRPDMERRLQPEGREEAIQMAQWLKENHLIPDRVICSPAARTRQTFDFIASALELEEGIVQWEQQIYEAGIGNLIDAISRTDPKAQTLLLIGHNPGIHRVAGYLADPEDIYQTSRLAVPPATLFCLQTQKSWDHLADGDATLHQHITPQQLNAASA